MRRVIACLAGLALLAPLANGELLANGIRMGQPSQTMSEKIAGQRATEKVAGIPLYKIALGAAAVAMTGSLVALRVIRKRNGK